MAAGFPVKATAPELHVWLPDAHAGSPDDIAPHPPRQPGDRIEQSLDGAALTPMQGPSACVPAPDDPALR